MYISVLYSFFMGEFHLMDISYWTFGLFSLLTVINNAAVNNCASFCVDMFSFFWGVYASEWNY